VKTSNPKQNSLVSSTWSLDIQVKAKHENFWNEWFAPNLVCSIMNIILIYCCSFQAGVPKPWKQFQMIYLYPYIRILLGTAVNTLGFYSAWWCQDIRILLGMVVSRH
jgi:hypothetical protein